MKMNILVTGATGFIGGYLVRELLERGEFKVYCLVRNSKKAKPLLDLGAELIYGDITKFDSLEEILKFKIDILFHCAGFVENRKRVLLHKTNVLGTENICKLAKELNTERMVYLSSVAVVSGNDCVPLHEDLPYKANNIYGESKIEAEKVVLNYRRKGLNVIIFRLPPVYGEAEPHLLKKIIYLLKLRMVPLINGGKNKLHLAYVRNVVQAILFSLDDKRFLEGTFFVADSEVLTTKEFFTILSKAVNVPSPRDIPKILSSFLYKLPFTRKKLGFFLKDRVYSTERIRNLGFRPPYPARESLTKAAEHFMH